jgi:hypothetical protein
MKFGVMPAATIFAGHTPDDFGRSANELDSGFRPKIRRKDALDGPWTLNRKNIKTTVVHCVGPDVLAIEGGA